MSQTARIIQHLHYFKNYSAIPNNLTYECEVQFSSLLQIKTKHRNILSVDDDLLHALSSTVIRKESPTLHLGEFLTAKLLNFQFLINYSRMSGLDF
jgi:hypothetical protein